MIDARGFSCPLPVIMVQKAVQKDSPASLAVLVDAQVAVENITRYAHSQGYQVQVTPEGRDFKLILEK
ncbi:TusA-related sulfurtransferase [Oscillibacter sp. PC13]|jgi:tRNA 2-thiouridine synthesizing protein A|uniref:sulfurtransferase TusA family protein n=1 Tax=Oscillibacter sp. PC13 TaxID=1855299 RepID=UPI0008E8FC2E|nr:sulfurtransferase TusA family protein [Oscillibacter sp. PC13]SFQ07018.1 TusA-related sulfurtransferase [Oscillibacter sp. PC13]